MGIFFLLSGLCSLLWLGSFLTNTKNVGDRDAKTLDIFVTNRGICHAAIRILDIALKLPTVVDGCLGFRSKMTRFAFRFGNRDISECYYVRNRVFFCHSVGTTRSWLVCVAAVGVDGGMKS